jgi:acetyl-CoA synthetase
VKAVAQKNISSDLQENRLFPAPARFRRESSMSPESLARMYDKAAEDYVGFWADLAVAEIDWRRPFTVPLDDTDAPNFRWFTDGQMNVSHNCLDVHLATSADKVAIIFEGEPGDVRRLTYRELHAEVCRCANALKAQGVGKGDRIVIYMPRSTRWCSAAFRRMPSRTGSRTRAPNSSSRRTAAGAAAIGST